MRSYIQNGAVIFVPALAGSIASGDKMIIGNNFGIAAHSAGVGDPVQLATTGVYQLPKATAAILTVGARLAWDNTAKHINVPDTRRFPVGSSTEAAGNGIDSVAVRLDRVETVTP